MGYTIRYPKGDDAARKALMDIYRFIGIRRYADMVYFSNHPNQPLSNIRGMFFMLLGVDGKPVEEFIKRYHPKMNGGRKFRVRKPNCYRS